MAQEHLMIFLHSFIKVERQILTSIYLINLLALPPSKTMSVYCIKCDSHLEIGHLIVTCLILKLSTYQDC